jgi:hypothetical protein
MACVWERHEYSQILTLIQQYNGSIVLLLTRGTECTYQVTSNCVSNSKNNSGSVMVAAWVDGVNLMTLFLELRKSLSRTLSNPCTQHHLDQGTYSRSALLHISFVHPNPNTSSLREAVSFMLMGL